MIICEILVLLLSQVGLIHAGFPYIQPEKVGYFSVKNAGFITIYNSTDYERITYDLVISSFSGSPFSKDDVYMVRDVGNKLDNVQDIKPDKFAQGLTWPNEVAGVPEEVFGRKVIVIPEGFLVPFKTKGSILLVNSSGDSRPLQITEGSGEEWFYHRVQWVDMDGDGDFDALTCRARKPIFFGKEAGELLWYENPSVTRPHWTPHVLAQGPDVYFTHARLNTSDGYKECVFTAQFFTKSLSVYWTEGKDWTDPSKIHSRVIDDTIGAVFDVQVLSMTDTVSLNLFVTTNDAHNGTVLVYDLPDDFRTGDYPRHTIETGFKPRKDGTGKGAPGSAVPVKFVPFPYRHSFILSGDDDGRAYVLESVSANWDFNLTPFLDVGEGPIGQIAMADVNNDTMIDVFVPSYTEGRVYVYRFDGRARP